MLYDIGKSIKHFKVVYQTISDYDPIQHLYNQNILCQMVPFFAATSPLSAWLRSSSSYDPNLFSARFARIAAGTLTCLPTHVHTCMHAYIHTSMYMHICLCEYMYIMYEHHGAGLFCGYKSYKREHDFDCWLREAVFRFTKVFLRLCRASERRNDKSPSATRGLG